MLERQFFNEAVKRYGVKDDSIKELTNNEFKEILIKVIADFNLNSESYEISNKETQFLIPRVNVIINKSSYKNPFHIIHSSDTDGTVNLPILIDKVLKDYECYFLLTQTLYNVDGPDITSFDGKKSLITFEEALNIFNQNLFLNEYNNRKSKEEVQI